MPGWRAISDSPINDAKFFFLWYKFEKHFIPSDHFKAAFFVKGYNIIEKTQQRISPRDHHHSSCKIP